MSIVSGGGASRSSGSAPGRARARRRSRRRRGHGRRPRRASGAGLGGDEAAGPAESESPPHAAAVAIARRTPSRPGVVGGGVIAASLATRRRRGAQVRIPTPRANRLKKAGVDVEKTYNQDELAKGKELVFAASGVTKGELLDGVRILPDGAIVHSICMRLPSGTVEKSETALRFKGHPVYQQFMTP